MNNIFEYSPKELTTDAFLKWIFCELNKDQYTDSVAQFFFQLGLCENRNSSIRTIHVSLQEQKTDLILRYVENGEEQKVLFENKTRTTIHSEQLQRYKEIFPNCDYYKYLKLAYIFHSERKIASQNGYDVIDVHMIYAALKGLKSNHYLVCQYMEFLSIKFIEPMNRITKDLIRNNEYSLFKDGQAQQYFLSHLDRKLDGLLEDLFFESSSNTDGTPWTQLTLAKRPSAYNGKNETIFWRIDMRTKKYYLRLNQYSKVGDGQVSAKLENLSLLRPEVEKLCLQYDLKLGKMTNRAKIESEIVILFFEDNDILHLQNILPELSLSIYRLYSSVKNWK